MLEFRVKNREEIKEAFKVIDSLYSNYRKNDHEIIFKEVRKKKSSSQHRAYWRAIGELKKAMAEQGNYFNEDELHNFVKRESGFTKTVILKNNKTVMINKSVSDISEDATSANLVFLIDWIIQFAREYLAYEIKIN